MKNDSETRHVHDRMNFVGIRAPLTAAAVLQLVRELRRAGVIEEDAVDRVKEAVVREADLFRRPNLSKKEFESSMRAHLDRLFAADRSEPTARSDEKP